MKIVPLTLEHKNLLYDSLRSVDTKISEYSFANLYLFRKRHNYKLLKFGYNYIMGTTVDDLEYIMPCYDICNKGVDEIYKLAYELDRLIFPIDQKCLNLFDQHKVDIKCNEADRDYIYTLEKMCTYKGRKLHKKRNLLKQFIQSYNYKVKPLTEDEIDSAKVILDEWANDSGMKKEETDYDACKEALDLLDVLVLCGLIYYVDNDPAGFILGEEIHDDTFAVHFAKAKKNYKGIYQFIYNNFAKVLPKKYKYLNFEQDLGKASLKITKSSYIPDILLDKYRIIIKK
jgi:hypothetical protein